MLKCGYNQYIIKVSGRVVIHMKKTHDNLTKQVIYYSDELNDEFSKAVITPRVIDEKYDYGGGILRALGRFVFYYIIARPAAYIFLKIKFHHKIENKQVLEESRLTGYFLYGNHTNDIADALIPTIVSYPRGVYVIVHPNNVSMPFLGRITPSLGAVPLPGDKKAVNNFVSGINNIIRKKGCVAIYPEAHIWPYYTKIRNFKDTSFRYPVKEGVPAFCFTNTYQKKRWGKGPRIVTYVDGPFYPASDIPVGAARKKLRDEIYETMKKRSENNTVEMIKYIKKEDQK